MSGLIIKVETQFMMEMTKRKPGTPRIEKSWQFVKEGFFMLGVRISAEIRWNDMVIWKETIK